MGISIISFLAAHEREWMQMVIAVSSVLMWRRG